MSTEENKHKLSQKQDKVNKTPAADVSEKDEKLIPEKESESEKQGDDSSSTVPSTDIASLNTDAFNALVNYVQEDLSSVVEDYKLLERMNRVTISKYGEMKEISTGVHIEMVKINDKYRCLVPCLEQIDQIEENVTSLEEVAYRLDAYSKRLEAKFKQLEKR